LLFFSGNGEDAADLDPPYFEKGNFPYLTTAQQIAIGDQLGAFSAGLRNLPTDYESRSVNHEHAYMMMVTDMRARCPTNTIAKMLSQIISQPVYRYIFKMQPVQRIDALGRGFWSQYAFRGVDMLAAFGAFSGYYSNYFKGKEKFEESMQKNLAEFASKGKISQWNFLPNEYMVLNVTAAVPLVITDTTAYKDCNIFTNASIDMRYAWMN
jgi:carboxylesterase type B